MRSAFPAERIDGEAAFLEWGGSYPDAEAYSKAVDGKTWEQLDAHYIILRHDALGFLSTRQLVQVLPIYLRSLADDGVMSPALDAVLVKLTRPTSEPSCGRFDALLAALSTSQRNAIAATLGQIADEDPDGSPGRAARAALDTWKAEL
ncbi:MAG TPA: hypothetical protein VK427_25645 [Kofleriaceae bacterium]|nr:hypothetical protein [Kofleriaceae bacterium]